MAFGAIHALHELVGMGAKSLVNSGMPPQIGPQFGMSLEIGRVVDQRGIALQVGLDARMLFEEFTKMTVSYTHLTLPTN